jgi:hypothetical protein
MNKQTSEGLTLPTILLIIFIVLKLTNLITWSWLWVLSPLWITFGIWIAIILLFVIFKIMF